MANSPAGIKTGAASRPCMANNSAGTKLGAASHTRILAPNVALFKGDRPFTQY